MTDGGTRRGRAAIAAPLPLKVRFKRLDPAAERPRRGSAQAAAWDLTATRVETEYLRGGLEVVTVHTGIAVEIPDGWYGDVRPRSSVYRTGLTLSNGCGVVDSDYRGEIMARFYRLCGGDDYAPGERCVQLIIAPCPEVEWEEADELTVTVRGAGGYGSSGK